MLRQIRAFGPDGSEGLDREWSDSRENSDLRPFKKWGFVDPIRQLGW